MLDKLNKVEEKVNELLSKLVAVFVRLIHKLIPKRFFSWINTKKLNTKNRATKIKQRSISKLIALKNSYSQFTSKVFTTIEKAQKYPIKEKGIGFAFKSLALAKVPPKQHWLVAKPHLIKTWNKVSEKLSILKQMNLRIISISAIIFIIGFSLSYSTIIKVYNQSFPKRKIASVQEYDDVKEYKSYDSKMTKVLNSKVPIYVHNVNSISSITIDYTIRTSTKFAKIFLEENEYRVKDYFFTNIEPIESAFPLTKEGKQILREKIRYELNNFLKNQNVEGKVLEVKLIDVIAS